MRHGIEYEDYRKRLASQLDKGLIGEAEGDACCLAEAVLHAMAELDRHKRADTLTPDTAGDLLDDLRHIVAGVL